MFDYSKQHRCLYCDKIITNNKNMVRIWPDKSFHVICDRRMREQRIIVKNKKHM